MPKRPLLSPLWGGLLGPRAWRPSAAARCLGRLSDFFLCPWNKMRLFVLKLGWRSGSLANTGPSVQRLGVSRNGRLLGAVYPRG